VDEATGWDTAWVNFANKRKAWAYVQDQLPTTHPIVADIPDLEAAKQNFDGITYAKGASVLKQLVAYVGFEAFIAGSREYFRKHAYGNTSLADLLAALSASSGRDLAGWAQQWLQTSGISTLSLEIVPGTDDDGVLGAVAIVQDATDPVTGREELRPHRLRVGSYTFDTGGALVRTGSIETDVTGARADLPELAGQPRPALLLVNDDDLTYAKVRLDPASEATVRTSLDRVEDPMARALCWTALWNSARDGESPSSRYVDAVAAFGPAETGIGVLLNILENASTAVERYTPATARYAVRSSFLAAAAAELDRAAPGSDQQLAWARTVGTLSRHDDAMLSRLRSLLDGTATVKGLAVDAELRWHFWHALAAQGLATVEELDTELARDTTASGRAGHATALAARPDTDVKAAAWQAAVHGNELSNQLLSATISGFTTAPAALLEPYVEPYFECLRSVWDSRSIEIASRIVRGLYPMSQDLAEGAEPSDHPVIRRTDAWLADNAEAPRALRRIIVEQRSHLLRALTAQAAVVVKAAPVAQ
jgi:aminopeptidase N